MPQSFSEERSNTGGRDVDFWKNSVKVFQQDVTGWGYSLRGNDPDTGLPTAVNGPASFAGRWIDGHQDYTVLGKIDEFRLSDTIRLGTLESGSNTWFMYSASLSITTNKDPGYGYGHSIEKIGS